MGLIMKNGIQYPGVGSGEGSGLEISQLDDVKITTPLADKESLVYNKEIGKWENKKISNESSLPYNLIVSEKWDNNISGGASENTVWTSKIFLTKGTYSIYDYVSWNSSKRIWYRYYFREMSDDFEGYFHGSQDHSQTNVTTDSQGWATFTTNEQFTIIKGTAKIQLVFWGDAGAANSGGGVVSLYKIDGLNNSSGITELPIASAETLGGIKVGKNLSITEDGTLNAEASGSSVLSPGAVIYDEQERMIGRWTDGRPIYQKTVTTTERVICNYIDYINVPCSNLPVNIDNLLCCKISQDFHSFYMTVAKIDSDNILKIWSSAPQGSLGLNAGTYITLQYTKTTDEPNSFRPDMIENISIMRNLDFSNIYSTDERIVGSWINGKPIYQKVINLSETVVLHSSVWTNIVMIENMEKIIDIECIRGNELNDGRLRWNCLNNYICGAAEEDNFNIRSGTVIILKYIKTIDEENSFTPDMITDHENITDAEIEAAAAADKI